MCVFVQTAPPPALWKIPEALLTGFHFGNGFEVGAGRLERRDIFTFKKRPLLLLTMGRKPGGGFAEPSTASVPWPRPLELMLPLQTPGVPGAAQTTQAHSSPQRLAKTTYPTSEGLPFHSPSWRPTPWRSSPVPPFPLLWGKCPRTAGARAGVRAGWANQQENRKDTAGLLGRLTNAAYRPPPPFWEGPQCPASSRPRAAGWETPNAGGQSQALPPPPGLPTPSRPPTNRGTLSESLESSMSFSTPW